MFRPSIVVALGLLVAGCASPPPLGQLESPVELPESWSSAEARSAGPNDASLSGEWWTSFGEPELDALVSEALAHNHDLAAAAARVGQASAQARIAGADRWPTLNGGVTRDRRKQNFIGLPFPGAEGSVISSQTTSWSASLTSSWELDLWGRVRAGAIAANAEGQAVSVEQRGAQLSIAALVARTWFGLAEARQQVELSSATVESYRVSAEQVRSRFEQGTRTSLDLRLALSSVASAEARLEQQRSAHGSLVRALEVLLGRYPARELTNSLDLLQLDEHALSPIPVGLPAELLERRPDVVAAERRWVAADRRVWQAKASLLPRISLTGSAGRSSTDLEDLTDGDFSVWSLITNLAQPIFQGGRLRANVSLAGSTRDGLAASFASTVLIAFSEVENALAAEAHLVRQERFIQEAAEQARAARLLAEDRYRAGLVDYTAVLQSQQQSLAAESEVLTVRRRRLDARTDLITALGGGWSKNTDSLQGAES